jgi:hypothetical protein
VAQEYNLLVASRIRTYAYRRLWSNTVPRTDSGVTPPRQGQSADTDPYIKGQAEEVQQPVQPVNDP